MSEPGNGHKTALELALEAHVQRENRRAPQGDLFAEPEETATPPGGQVAPRGPGRPPGARNRRTEHLVDFYVRAKYQGRHPLDMALAVATLPILSPGVLPALALDLGCTKFEAAKFWQHQVDAVLPYAAQRQSAIEIRPAGAPGSGNPITWEVFETVIEGEVNNGWSGDPAAELEAGGDR